MLLVKIFKISAVEEYSGRKIKVLKTHHSLNHTHTTLQTTHTPPSHSPGLGLCRFFSTAEAVLQKMDDMKKRRRRRMREFEDLEVFNETEEVNIFCH